MNTTGYWSPRRLFRTVAIAEAITWTLLILGMIGKYLFDLGGLGVTVGGGLHGFVFLLYVAVAVVVGVNQRWSGPVVLVTLITSILPFATIPWERGLEKRGRLDGDWRRTADGDPADARAADRVLRTLLAHPGRMALAGLVAVAVIFAALLVVGPPGSRA